ncbi:MAG: NAD-dependent epimerase/dehydratase family protein [Desulfatibacillaceae bacterium]|nr:NAD-dependent epimerase/dehydratase family protein [Desulfatibacillaceae bacterium]
MEKVLITGATGFIGSHLADANLKAGRFVRALVLPGDSNADALAAKGVEIIWGDIADAKAVSEAVKGMDIVFHCAAVVTDWAPKALFEKVTVGGTQNICHSASKFGVSRLVYLSTNDVFGLDETRVLDEACPLVPWKEPYPDFKIEAEKIVWRYWQEKGLPVSMAYPCWVYGPGDRSFVPLLADAIIKKEMLFWRKGPLVWPTYIDNLVDLLMLLSRDNRALGNGYLAHDGVCTTLEEFCAGIAEALGVTAPSWRIPYSFALAAGWCMEKACSLSSRTGRPLLTTYAVKNLGSRLSFSIDKAKNQLGWRPLVSFEKGFDQTLKWLLTLDRKSLKQK